jgi:hypothetical protein
MARGRKRKQVSEEIIEKEVNELNEMYGLEKEMHEFIQSELIPKYVKRVEPTLVSTGVKTLDTLLGGGFYTSLFSMMSSPPETGKSTIALQSAANFLKEQQRKKEHGFVIYIDVESSPVLLPGQKEFPVKERIQQFGISKDDPRFIYMPGIKTFERILEAIHQFVQFKLKLEQKYNLSNPIPTILIWDSIAETITESIAEKAESGEAVVNPLADKRSIVATNVLSEIAYLAEQNNIGLIILDQVRALMDLQPGRSNKNTVTSSHANLRSATNIYGVNHKIRQFLFLEKKSEINMDYPGVLGWILRIHLDKNKVVPSTGMSVDIVFDKSTGINPFWSHFHFLSNRMQYEEKIMNKVPKSIQNKYLEYAPLVIQGTKFFHPKLMDQPISFRSKLDLYRKYQNDEEFRELFDKVLEQSIKERIESFIHPSNSFFKELVDIGEIGKREENNELEGLENDE